MQKLWYIASCCTQIVELVDDSCACALHRMCMSFPPAYGAEEEGGGTSLGLGLGHIAEGCCFGSRSGEQELLDESTLVCRARGHTFCPSSGGCSQSCLSFCYV